MECLEKGVRDLLLESKSSEDQRNSLTGCGAKSSDEDAQQESEEEEKKVCRIALMLEVDHIISVFSFFDGYALSSLAYVCKDWSAIVRDPLVWRNCCAQVWKSVDELERLVQHRAYKLSWFLLFKRRNFPRWDGFYLVTHAYMQYGGDGFMSGRCRMPVQVKYFRYLRFHPDGSMVYALCSPSPIKLSVEKTMDVLEKKKLTHTGRYSFTSSHIEVAVNCGYIDNYFKFSMWETAEGFHDRLSMQIFKGRCARTQEIRIFPVPEQPFIFYSDRNIETIRKEGLLAPNGDIMAPDL